MSNFIHNTNMNANDDYDNANSNAIDDWHSTNEFISCAKANLCAKEGVLR